MIAEFSVYMPDQEHLSPLLADILSLLEKKGIEFTLGATSTSIRGEPARIFPVLAECYELMEKVSSELVMNINIVNSKIEHHNLNENISSVHKLRERLSYG